MKYSKIDIGVAQAEAWTSLGNNINSMLNFAHKAEKLGYYAIHIGDHIHMPFESLTYLTAVAVKTEKLYVATNILDMNRRNPATVAHATATLDHVSGGRFILGAGCGMWNWSTYNVSNIGDAGRIKISRKVSRAKEAIEVLKKFWTEPEVNYKGEFYYFENAKIDTKPFQKPHPPIWIAAYGTRMKRIAARLGDGFITQTLTPPMYKEEVEKVKIYAKKMGRNPTKLKSIFATLTSIAYKHNNAVEAIQESAKSLLFRSVRDHSNYHNRLAERLGYDTPLPWEKPEDISSEDICQVYLIGTPEEIITRIEQYIKSGMKYLIVMGLCSKDSLNLFSEKIISCFKE